MNNPPIRFNGYKDDWENCKFGDVLEEFSNQSTVENEYTVLSSTNTGMEFRDGRVSGKSNLGYKIIDIDDLVLSPQNLWLGNININNLDKGLVSPSYKTFKLRNIDKEFFRPQLRTKKMIDLYKQASTQGASVVRRNLDMDLFAQIEITIPRIEEQTMIGQYFANLNNLILLQQQKCENIKKLKKYMLQKMFPLENETKPQIRFSEYTNAWEQRKVSEYANFFTGNGLNWNDISDDGEQECILYGNLYTDYGMITENIVYRTNTEIKNPVYSEYGDVLIPASDTTPTGLARATSLEKSGVLLGGDINIIRPNKGINGSCLSLALNANRKELIRLIKGTTVRHIHNSEIKDIVICLPKLETEQVRISSYFKRLDHLITLHQRKLEKLKQIKKALLDKMFV